MSFPPCHCGAAANALYDAAATPLCAYHASRGNSTSALETLGIAVVVRVKLWLRDPATGVDDVVTVNATGGAWKIEAAAGDVIPAWLATAEMRPQVVALAKVALARLNGGQ